MLLAGTLAAGGVVAAISLGDLSVRTGSTPLGVAALGVLIVAPSAGHLYAGATDHAIITSLGRAASFGLILVAASESDRSRDLAEVGQMVGAYGFLGVIVYNIVDAPFAARRFNRRARAAASTVSPTLIPVVGGTAPGLSLRGVF